MQINRQPKTAIVSVLSTSFRYLWIAQIFSQLAVNMMLFTLALLIYQSTESNAAVSGLFLAYGVPSILFGVLAGVAVDHFDKKYVLLVCDLLRASLVVILFLVLPNPFAIYGIVFLHALITQFYVPAEAPTIPRLVAPELIVSANSLFSFTYYSSMAVGFILAGPSLRYLGAGATFGLICFLFLLAASLVSRLQNQPGTHTLTMVLRKDIFDLMSQVLVDLKEGIAYATRSRVLFDALVLLTGTQIVLVVLASLGPGFAHRVLEIDVRDASLFITLPAVIGIVGGALWVGERGYRYQTTRLINTGILAAGAVLIIVSVVVRMSRVIATHWFFESGLGLPIVFFLFILLGIANSLLDVPANSTLQKEAAGSMRGRVYGMLTAAVGGVGMLPVVAGGILADVIGVGKVIFGLGLVITAYGAWRIRYNNRNI